MTSLDISSFINKLYILKAFYFIDRHLSTASDVCVTAPHLVSNGKQQHITHVIISSTQNMLC